MKIAKHFWIGLLSLGLLWEVGRYCNNPPVSQSNKDNFIQEVQYPQTERHNDQPEEGRTRAISFNDPFTNNPSSNNPNIGVYIKIGVGNPYNFLEERIKEFGTVENPLYNIKKQLDEVQKPNKKRIVLEQCYEEKIQIQPKKNGPFKIIKNRIKKIKQNHNKSKKQDVSELDYLFDDHPQQETSLLDEIGLAKQILSELTGMDFPRIKIVKIDAKKILGDYNPYTMQVGYVEKSKQVNLGTLLHEFGHAIAQYHEQVDSTSRKEIRVLEEASAYAFENAGLYYLLNEREGIDCDNSCLSIRAKFISDIDTRFTASTFYEGKDDVGNHGEGAAVFLATYKFFNYDPYKTFNYIISLPNLELDPEIKKIMDTKFIPKEEFDGLDEANFKCAYGLRSDKQ